MVSDACRELLLDAQRFSATYGPGFANHLPMALVALDRLGGDEARLQAFFAVYSKQLRPKTADEVALTAQLRDASVAEVVPQLTDAVASQAFHGAIRVAYALDSGENADMPSALAAWIGTPASPPAGPAASRRRHFATFPDAFNTLAHDDRLPPNLAPARSIDARIQRVVALPAFADYHDTIAEVSLRDIAVTSARVYAATGDFTALHMVTGCHAMRVLAPFAAPRMLHVFATAILAAYVTIGRPPLATAIPDDLPDDATLAARAVPSDDDHDLKMVYSSLREEAEYQSGWHRLGAAVRLG